VSKNGLLLYLSYGTGAHEKEVAYSFLTAQHWAKSHAFRVLIMTDHPESFTDLGVEIDYISAEEWSTWSGPHNFNHRRKIVALQRALANHKVPVVLLDGDTWLRQPVGRLFERIGPGRSLMHIREGRISRIQTPLMRSMADFLDGNSFTLSDGSAAELSSESQMWNAGVVGLHPDDAGILNDVLALTDQFCQKSDLHVLEQFAFSHLLSERTVLNEADDLVFHYWPPYLHEPFRKRINDVFEQSKNVPEANRLEYFFAKRPRPTWTRRGKVILKRCAQALGLIRGRCRSNEW
jgi:hypothetical protein